jgi:hypothetical protein
VTTAQGLAELLAQAPTGLRSGALRYHAQQARRAGNSRLAELLDRAARQTHAAPPVGRHPGDRARRDQQLAERGLSDSDRIWLSRLPSDPSAVTFDDAEALAGLVASVGAMKHPGDARLLASIWSPVKTIHDRRHAAETVATARAPLSPLPDGCVAALAAIVATEVTGLSADEVTARAGEMLRAAVEGRDQERAQVVARAEQRAMAVDLHEYARTATE